MSLSAQPPFACDVHTHTIFSRHAYSTIGECVAAARAAGLELLGSTDHYSCMTSPTLHVRDYQYFINFDIWPRVWDGVQVLRGVEADIVDLDGNLFGWDHMLYEGITGRAFEHPHTLKEHVWRNIDYAIASIHDKTFADHATLSQTTEMYVRVLDDPKVFILGHVGRTGVPFDVDEVLIAAKEHGKLIEINEHSLMGQWSDRAMARCRQIAQRCAELGVGIAVNTDAHIATDIGRFDNAHALLEDLGFPEHLVATRSADAFMEALETAGIPYEA